MPLYYCKCCNFRTDLKSNFSRHLKTGKHFKKIESKNLVTQKRMIGNTEVTQTEENNKICKFCLKEFTTTQSTYRHMKHFCKSKNKNMVSEKKRMKNDKNSMLDDASKKSKIPPKALEKNIVEVNEIPKNKILCKYCSCEFTTKQAMYRHMKYTCRKCDDEDLKELVRLLNTQIKQQQQGIDNQTQIMLKQQQQINKLSHKLQINVNNGITFNTNNFVNNNIKLLNYRDSDISHLTDRDYYRAIKQVNFCVMNLMQKIHFNPAKPENMNIYIPNIKDKYIMIYEDEQWKLKDRQKELDNIYDHKEMLLEDWLNEQDNFPVLKKSFERYLNNRDNNEVFNMIKDEIKMMMYNNRDLVKKYKDLLQGSENTLMICDD